MLENVYAQWLWGQDFYGSQYRVELFLENMHYDTAILSAVFPDRISTNWQFDGPKEFITYLKQISIVLL